jgi:hypothetical protein
VNSRACLVALALLISACTPNAVPPASAVSPAVAAVPAPPTCAVGDPRAALGSLTERPSAALIQQLGTGIDTYHLQDGVWLEHAPVLVNEDFDFGTAMGLGAIGAGLAAKQRADHNAARARELTAFALSAKDRLALEAWRACGIHRWALLWGGTNPHLWIITEHYDPEGKLTRTDQVESPAAMLDPATLWAQSPDPQRARPGASASGTPAASSKR